MKRLTGQDATFAMILQFIAIQTDHMLERTAPKTRRHNQLTRIKEHVAKADETFEGYLEDEQFAKAEKVFNEFSIYMERIFEDDDPYL